MMPRRNALLAGIGLAGIAAYARNLFALGAHVGAEHACRQLEGDHRRATIAAVDGDHPERREQAAGLRGQRHRDCATVVRMGQPFGQSLPLQVIDRGDHRVAMNA